MACPGSLKSLSTDHITPTAADRRQSSQRFRFKSKASKRHIDEDVRNSSRSSSHQPHRRHHRYRHRDKRHKVTPSAKLRSPSPYEGSSSTLHPDVAFRESLFDAMGDDEGAAYWESVYGQPIHNYPDQKWNEETGKLHKMDEEEYIAFVRRGMWERSWEGIEAQKEERRRKLSNNEEEQKSKSRERRRRKKKIETAGNGGAGPSPFERQVEESLRRGQHRKEKTKWREAWNTYEHAWGDLCGLAKSKSASRNGTSDKAIYLRNEIVWPVESGRTKDVGPQEIERFMVKTAASLVGVDDSAGELHQLLSNLKVERVRWHPDKVQQRFGTLNIDEWTLKGVTEVFQIMDRLYNERR